MVQMLGSELGVRVTTTRSGISYHNDMRGGFYIALSLHSPIFGFTHSIFLYTYIGVNTTLVFLISIERK